MNRVSMASAVEESRHVLSILIDGRPLRELFAGRRGGLPPQVSPFGWSEEADAEAVGRFLLEAPPDFEDGRCAVLVCRECGDPACGAYSVRIRREGDIIRWSDFGFQSSSEPGLETERYAHLGPFEFLWRDYEQTFRSVAGRTLEETS